MEFEPIYREEAKGRQRLSPGRGQKVCTNGADLLEKGTSREFMARDSAASEHPVQRILCKGVSNSDTLETGRRKAQNPNLRSDMIPKVLMMVMDRGDGS